MREIFRQCDYIVVLIHNNNNMCMCVCLTGYLDCTKSFPILKLYALLIFNVMV